MKYLIIIQAILYLLALLLGLKFFILNKSPLYYKLLFLSIACFFLEKLYYLVDYACTGAWQTAFSFAAFAAGAGYAFLFSANYGQFDSFVDDGSEGCKRARNVAFIAPVVLIAFYSLVLLFCIKASGDILFFVLTIVSKLPIFFAAYYHLKHLVLPDVMHFMVDSLRPFNAACLLLIASDIISDAFAILGHTAAYTISEAIIAFILIVLIFVAEWGHKQWKI